MNAYKIVPFKSQESQDDWSQVQSLSDEQKVRIAQSVEKFLDSIEKTNLNEREKGKYRRALMRAVRMLQSGLFPVQSKEEKFLVPSEEKDVYYFVDAKTKTCDCPSTSVCKHRALVAICAQLNEGENLK